MLLFFILLYLKDKKNSFELLFIELAQLLFQIRLQIYKRLVKDEKYLTVIVIEELLELDDVITRFDEDLEVFEATVDLFLGVEYLAGELLATRLVRRCLAVYSLCLARKHIHLCC